MNVALRCGFAHCGRFSVEYRRRYGETPSQTLKRQAVLANAPASKSLILVASRDQPAIALSPVDVIP
jgi:AraC-like DNA-binding protein